MKGIVALVVLWAAPALAEQPRGRYTLDRGSLTYLTDERGNPHPSCGGEKVFGGQATFVVEYGGKDKLVVNKREWRFYDYSRVPGEAKPRPEAQIIAVDPDSTDQIFLWFGMDRNTGVATGLLHVEGVRDKKRCSDAWHLVGKYWYK